eukprot:TRINITY_DN6823_c0_g1_i11.p1 TRINITY_DN6823_c0_g1~~TRINITY_DN6823_c0_g1_i11.p1  ORF type:complete len:855 (+),score=103.85 TRINITY_DN6823_c0_g1_i11:62-2626(+)
MPLLCMCSASQSISTLPYRNVPKSIPIEPHLLDIRKHKHVSEKTAINDVGRQIVQGLQVSNGTMKSIPTLVLYDDKGLQLFDEITYLEEYYLTNAEIDVIVNNISEILEYIPSGAKLVELGSGSLRKTSLILDAVNQTRKNVEYYALDLAQSELRKSLENLDVYDNVSCYGLWGDYHDGIEFLAEMDRNQPIIVMWLGSSIGNMDHHQSVCFLKEVQEKALRPGDFVLVGMDKRNQPERIRRAYYDSKNVTRDFIMNGLDHVNEILGQEIFERDNFKYHSVYNDFVGRHEAYYRALEDQTLDFEYEGKNVVVGIKKDELVNVEYSYKYSKTQSVTILNQAGLCHLLEWLDTKEQYGLHMAQKPSLIFPYALGITTDFSRVLYSQKSQLLFPKLPSLSEFEELWNAWDSITEKILTKDAYFKQPIDLRNPFIFYLGHIPGFLDILLSRGTKESLTEPKHLASIFERGVDPDVDDPSICHDHSPTPETWPEISSILAYKQDVRDRVRGIYNKYVYSSTMPNAVQRVIFMSFEHEVMHLETLLYMMVQDPSVLGAYPIDLPKLNKYFLNEQIPSSSFVKISSGSILIGHDDIEGQEAESHEFGWDNESPIRAIEIPSNFEIQSRPVSVGDYYQYYLNSNSKVALPASWEKCDGSLLGLGLKTMFGILPLEVALNMPVSVSHEEACDYLESKGLRLPTDAELRKAMDMYFESDAAKPCPNFGFSSWLPTDMYLDPVYHNHSTDTPLFYQGGWELTDTLFEAYDGFKDSEFYKGYSSDFFNGKHYVLLGGSYATHPRIAQRRSFRNWYQSKYRYAFTQFRGVRNFVSDNGVQNGVGEMKLPSSEANDFALKNGKNDFEN